MRGPRKFASFVGLLSVIAVCVFLILNFQTVDDWIKLRDYNPPEQVEKLAQEDTMTAEARHIFYVNHPDLIDTTQRFQQECPTYEQTIVIGCYHSQQRGIFLFNVADPRLNGLIEVTSAHEMLHGAYERLSRSEKSQLGSWLTDYFNNDLHDKRIIDTINAYKKTEPDSVVDEMHSVFGTEIKKLPSQLENYYKHYFTNRKVVTAFAESYEKEFTSRQNKIHGLEQRLETLKQQISSEEDSLNSTRAQIESDRQSLDNLRASGQTAAYNAAVSGFNNEVSDYNSGVEKLRNDISYFNQLVQQHNQLGVELRSLYNSLDTSLTTQSEQ